MAKGKLEQAIEFAVMAHAGDYRDGDLPLPYVSHAIEVMSLLRYVGGVTDEDLLVIACLHDVLEETQYSAASIEGVFGNRVASGVVNLTRYEPSALERGELTEQQVWELRSSILLGEISQMPEEIQAIKLADRLANIRQAKVTRKPKKLARYKRQTEEILRLIPSSVNPTLWQAVFDEL
ncbi:MAG: HD domain-containing protein [Armatimonadota bacterium]